MKIVLAEERAGKRFPEQSFDTEIVRIGRNADECQIAFETKLFPMVSRNHAELRWQGNRWELFDANSTYGTFVDGRRITAPEPVTFGSALQFGSNGPILKVVWLELVQDSSAPVGGMDNAGVRSHAPLNAGTAFEASVGDSPSPIRESGGTGSLGAIRPALEFIESGASVDPYRVTRSSITMGREPGGDIVFEASKVMVSRRHAEIREENGRFILHDNNSFNGTLVNEQRISTPTPLYHGDQIRLGLGGPLLRFNSPSRPPPKGASLAGQRGISISNLAELQDLPGEGGSKTMVVNVESLTKIPHSGETDQPQLLMSLSFGRKNQLIIGRAESSDIKLDGLQISNRHARLQLTGSGVVAEDIGSTNGVYLRGERISRQLLNVEDTLQIGAFVIRVDSANNVGVFDTRSKTRVDSVNITKDVRNRDGSGMLRLLDNVSLSIQPNEFIGLIGPSGAGKSTLMDAMNGMRPATGGSVLINNLDLYQHLDSLKQSIGYVPQDDIIHRELSVYRTLYYVAKLRLSRDVSGVEIDQIIDEVLDVTGLAERRNIAVSQLSGGQRKRVSIAVELITKPSIIFLDEPTSGLDPATEEKIMKLFRQIAESGRTVILTTHAMENVSLFDKLVVLMRGKLVFYGKPAEALHQFKAGSFKELYDKLEEPIEKMVREYGEEKRLEFTEHAAEEWKRKFTQTDQFRNNVYEPLKELGTLQSPGVRNKSRLGLFGSVRQMLTLARRYSEVLYRDKLTLLVLFAQAPIIALMTFFVMGKDEPRDFLYFMISLVAIWFGTSVAAREIIRERPVYKRERMVNLGILPYVASKLLVLGFIVTLQCLMLFLPLKVFDLVGLMPMPGQFLGIPQLWVMLLTAGVGIALGLLISAVVKTSELATSLVPLILIPQILFSGLVGVPQGINKAVGLFMPAAWSFDTMKRYSTLDTLEPEGAYAKGKTKGLGLYKSIESENDKIIENAKEDLADYREDSEKKLNEFETDMKNNRNPSLPKLGDPPKITDARKMPADLSGYVTFLHPWMHEILNQIVLMLMFGLLSITTLIVLRLQDIR